MDVRWKRMAAPKPTNFNHRHKPIVSLTNILKTLENSLGCFPLDYRP